MKHILAGALVILGLAFNTVAAEKVGPKKETSTEGQGLTQAIADLSSSNQSKVLDALNKIEKLYPTDTTSIPRIRELLGDQRLDVKAKAGRVLAVLHAEIDEKDVKNISTLLDPKLEPKWIIHGLKSLRYGKSAAAIPQITPLLTHAHPNVKRDACRALAVLGGKDLIPSIEPLLSDKDPAVQKDARDAISALKAKP